MNQITGWLLLLGVVVVLWGVVQLLRRRRSESHTEATTGDKGAPEKKDAKHDSKSHNGHGHVHESWFDKFLRGFSRVLGVLAVMIIFAAILSTALLGTRWLPSSSKARQPVARALEPKVPALPKGITMCTPFDTKVGERASCLASGQVAVLIPEGVADDLTCWGSSFAPGELQVVMEDGSTVEPFDSSKIDDKAVAFIVTPPRGTTRFYVYWLLAPGTPDPNPCHIA